jgi:FkbM family methyltransferase
MNVYPLSDLNEAVLSDILILLPSLADKHYPDSGMYRYLNNLVKICINNIYGEGGKQSALFNPLGEIKLPYYGMGAITSKELFGLDEIIIFSFYLKNKDVYKNVYDLGANIGLHSIILCKLGFNVTAYEPDPVHLSQLKKNLVENEVDKKITVIPKAVSSDDGIMEFTRVEGNTTGSHLSGSKDSPYGKLVKFNVEVECFKKILKRADLIKIDVEGHEAVLILATKKNDYDNTDLILEVGSKDNAQEILKHVYNIGVNMFSQKKAWRKVTELHDMPFSYKDGSLFITNKNSMPW